MSAIVTSLLCPQGSQDLIWGFGLPAGSPKFSHSYTDWSLCPRNKGSRNSRASSHTPSLPARSDSQEQVRTQAPRAPGSGSACSPGHRLRKCLLSRSRVPEVPALQVTGSRSAPKMSSSFLRIPMELTQRLPLHGVIFLSTNKRDLERRCGSCRSSEGSEGLWFSSPPPP